MDYVLVEVKISIGWYSQRDHKVQKIARTDA